MRYTGAVETRVRRYVRRRSLVKQLANDAFAKGFLKLKTLRDREKFRPWIFRLADREVMDYQRTSHRDQRRVHHLAAAKRYLARMNVRHPSGPELMEQKERLEQLSRAI